MTSGIPTQRRFARFHAALLASPHLWWALLYFFSLLCGYYVLRPVRDAMGASSDPAVVFPTWLLRWAEGQGIALGDYTLQILFSCTLVVMLSLQPVYGALVARFPRRVFLPVVYLAFIGCLLWFWWAFDSGLSGRGAMFFVFIAVFNLFAVTVFWSFMADVFANHEAKQVYGYIAAGGTIGAITGPMITRALVAPLGVANLLLVSCALMAVCLLCIIMLRPWAVKREQALGEASGEQAMGGSIWAGLKLIFNDPVLRALAMLMFFGVGVGTILYNEQAAIVRQYYPTAELATRYYSTLDWAINGLTIVVQTLLTRQLLLRYGVAPLLLAPAFAILVGFSLLAASPLPLFVAVVQVLTRASEFSLNKPARETLYTRMDRESRYKAKAMIDTAVYRTGDFTFVWLHKWLASFGSKVVFLAGLGIAAGLAFSAWQVVRTQRRLPENGPAEARNAAASP